MNIYTFKNEEWKQIKDFPRYYINIKGQIKSKYKNGKEKILKPSTTQKGYKVVYLSRTATETAEAIKKGLRVHRLVAKYFLEDYAEEKEVHHKNGKRDDNRAENLQCLTRKEHTALHRKKAAAESESNKDAAN